MISTRVTPARDMRRAIHYDMLMRSLILCAARARRAALPRLHVIVWYVIIGYHEDTIIMQTYTQHICILPARGARRRRAAQEARWRARMNMTVNAHARRMRVRRVYAALMRRCCLCERRHAVPRFCHLPLSGARAAWQLRV